MNETSSSLNEFLEVPGMRLASLTGVDMASRASRILWAELLRTTLDEALADPTGVAGAEETDEEARAVMRFLM